MKATPNQLLKFYRMYGLPIEITTTYELEELEQKPAAEVTKEVFDKFDPIRAHAMGVRLA